MAEVVLVNPPILEKKPALRVPPLGLGYLASSLRREGIEVKIIDAPALGINLEQSLNLIKRYSPRILGITATTPLRYSAYQLVREARALAKWIIMGGAHPSALGKKVFEDCPELDFGFRGEGEEQFPGLVKKLLEGEKEVSLPGVISRDKDSSPVLISELDSLGFPSWDLLPMRRYRHPLFPGKRIATIISSRGCPYQCIFCDKSVSGSKWRARSVGNVLAEIEELYFQEKIRALIFYDDLFTLDKNRVVEICRQIIKRGMKISWKCEGRVNIVDEEMLYWMKRAGCEIIAYGIETRHQEGLDWLKKGVSEKEIENAVRLTKKAGIKVLGYFIFGIPVENYEQELGNIKFAIELGLDYVQFGSLSPFPGSELYELALKQGWYQELEAPAPEEYGKRPLLITEYWTQEKLQSILKTAYRKFYFRPGYLFKKLISFRGILDLLRSGVQLQRWLKR